MSQKIIIADLDGCFSDDRERNGELKPMTFICIFERLNDKPRVKKIEEKHGFIRDIPTEVLEKSCFIYDDDARIIIKNRKGIKGVVTREVLRTEAARYRHSVAYSRKSRRGMETMREKSND